MVTEMPQIMNKMLLFIEKIEKRIKKYPKGCWIWDGAFKDNSPSIVVRADPVFRNQQKRINVREFLYGWELGIFPPGKVYRTCLNEKCVNPKHHTHVKPPKKSVVQMLIDELPADTDLGDIDRIAAPKNTSNTPGNRPNMPEMFEGNSYQKWKDIGSKLKKDLTEESDELD